MISRMNCSLIKTPIRIPLAAALVVATLGLSPAVHAAGLFDRLFGSSESATPSFDSRRKIWELGEFTKIQLVARESGSTPNQHPLQIDRELVRQILAQVRFQQREATMSLFDSDELSTLSEPLSQAFANAGPDDDVLLLSSPRRGLQPIALTARLFARDNALQLIVNDARFEFFNDMRGTNRAPTFVFGSREEAGKAVLRSTSGTNVRADWLALPLTTQAAAAPPAAVLPGAARPAAAAAGTVPAPAAAPMPNRADPAYANEVEQRLVTLKRLRDKNLISEEEYQQKRREILSQL